MKKINKQFLFSALTLVAILFSGCSKDDLTGQSTLEVSKDVKITITSDFSSPQTIIEGDNKYNFTVTLDKVQSKDIVVKINQVSGNASTDDYTVDSQLTIPAYKLSATAELTILKDNVKEDVETLTLQVGDITTANANITPVTVSFNIQNYTEGSLVTDLSWSTSIKDVAGDLIKPTDAADFKLRITNLNLSDVESIDDSETAFESFEMLSTMPDGDYLVVAEAVSFKDMGSQGNFDIDLSVTFNQTGIYNDETFTFTKAANSAAIIECGATGFFKLAQITKSGSTYTVSEVGEPGYTFDASIFNGTYKVVKDEWEDYAVGASIPVEYNIADGTGTFRILNTYVMANSNSYFEVTFDQSTGVVTKIVGSEPFKYNLNSSSSYFVSGTGNVNLCNGNINLNVTWKNQNNTNYGAYQFNLTKQ